LISIIIIIIIIIYTNAFGKLTAGIAARAEVVASPSDFNWAVEIAEIICGLFVFCKKLVILAESFNPDII